MSQNDVRLSELICAKGSDRPSFTNTTSYCLKENDKLLIEETAFVTFLGKVCKEVLGSNVNEEKFQEFFETLNNKAKIPTFVRIIKMGMGEKLERSSKNDENIKKLIEHKGKQPTDIKNSLAGYKICWEDKEKKSSMANNTENQLINLIKNGIHQIVLTGAPGTGKTYTAREVAKFFIAGEEYEEPTDDDINKQFEFVQFHPSYDYTDFVEGLRPVDDKNSGTMKFKRVDGIFMKFCRYVAWENYCKGEKNKDNKYFFVIDEINRADLSKVFGELMFCLEGDKRGKENGIKTQYANLTTHHIFDKNDEKRLEGLQQVSEWKQGGGDEQKKKSEQEKNEFYYTCFKDGFYIPENVVIIGTMNDIDRSVESMDFALRRRFTWLAVDVTKELLKTAFTNGKFFDDAGGQKETLAGDIAARVVEFNGLLNEKYGLKKDYDISQGQFSGIPKSEFDKYINQDSINYENLVNGIMTWVWKYRVKSLLREYLRGSDVDMEKELDDEKGTLTKLWLKAMDDTEDNSVANGGTIKQDSGS